MKLQQYLKAHNRFLGYCAIVGAVILFIISFSLLAQRNPCEGVDTWPSTMGTILQSEFIKGHFKDPNEEFITFQYAVGEILFESKTYSCNSGGILSRDSDARFTRGMSVPVFYNPSNNSQSYIINEPFHSFTWIISVVGAVIMLLFGIKLIKLT